MIEEASSEIGSQPEARRAGHAAAMIANLHLAGNAERTAVWEAEVAVWLERRGNAVQNARLPRQAEVAAIEATCLSYDLHAVTEPLV